jgi:hypothetical protein
MLAYVRCRRVCLAEWISWKKRSRGSRRRRGGGGVVALGPIACYCDGAFECYCEENDLVEEAVDFRVLLFERGEDCSLWWLSFWWHFKNYFPMLGRAYLEMERDGSW